MATTPTASQASHPTPHPATPHLDRLTTLGIYACLRQKKLGGGLILWLDPAWLVTPDVQTWIQQNRDSLIAEIRAAAPDGLHPAYRLLWVSTDLDYFEENDPRFGAEVCPGPVYRLLDPPYYAWLRSRMSRLKSAHEAGRVSTEQFDAMRGRFNEIHAWAVKHMSEETLRKAVASLWPGYLPPSDATYADYRQGWLAAWEMWIVAQAAKSPALPGLDEPDRPDEIDPFEGE